MSWFDKFKRKWRNFGIPNLMLYIVATTFVVFIADGFLGLNLKQYLGFSKDAVLAGQIWRLVTFIFLPATNSPFWIFISLLFYYNIGTALESQWGTSTFTLYYLLGIVFTVVAGFITSFADNTFLNLSLMLAYAQLFPDTTFRFYFLIPIKVKYVGYFQWGLYGISLIIFIANKNWVMIGAQIASLMNFFIFFVPDIIKEYKRRGEVKRRQRDYRRSLRNDDDDNNIN